MKNLIYKTGISLLIVLWIYAAGSKLLEYNSFRHQLTLQHFPIKIEGILVWLLPAIELITALLLTSIKTVITGLYASAVLLVMFTGYIAFILTGIYPNAPCSCGGVLSMLSWKAHFGFNLIFLSINVWALYEFHQKRKEARKENPI